MAIKPSPVDKISIIAIVGGLTAIIVGHALEGGHIGSLLQVTAFMIVIGGTFSAVMLQSTPKQFISGLRMASWVVQPPQHDQEKLIRDIVGWSLAARRGGLLALEGFINVQPDPFLRRGMQMLVDGTEPQTIRDVLGTEIDVFEQERKQAAKIWESAGGYAPTMGIIGAVLGLIHVMENLSDPSKLGGGIAVAFVATVYGVGSANLLLLPIAGKLKNLIAIEVAMKELMIEGLIAIANGENPRLIETRLRSFVGMSD